jgi:hypothetical protein
LQVELIQQSLIMLHLIYDVKKVAKKGPFVQLITWILLL